MRAKATAPPSERNEPETFCWTLSRRRSRSAWFLRKSVWNVCSGDFCWGEGDRIAALLQAPDVLALEPGVVKLLEVVRSQVMVGLVGAQHVIDADQEAMGDRHNGALFAAAPRESVIERRWIGVMRMDSGPGDLPQRCPSVARSQRLPGVLCPLKRLPPLCLFPGQTPAQEAR